MRAHGVMRALCLTLARLEIYMVGVQVCGAGRDIPRILYVPSVAAQQPTVQ
jgi:hypothetical protein